MPDSKGLQLAHRMRRVLLGGALLSAGVFVLAACGDDDNAPAESDGSVDASTTSEVTTSVSEPEASEPPDDTAEAALASVDQYFEALNAADIDAVLSLVTPEATLTRQFQSDGPAEFERGPWEAGLVFYATQGTVLTRHSCSVVDDQPAGVTTLSCDYETVDAPTQAVDAPPVPTRTTFVITSAGISEVHDNFDPSGTGVDFLHVGEPFRDWLVANHPDVRCIAVSTANVTCEDWPGNLTSVDTAGEMGPMAAQYAQEWAAFLEEDGCAYFDGC